MTLALNAGFEVSACAGGSRLGVTIHQLVIIHIGNRLFQRQRDRRCQTHRVIVPAAPHVVQLLPSSGFTSIILAACLADESMPVRSFLRADEPCGRDLQGSTAQKRD